jgi:hypothetical protein
LNTSFCFIFCPYIKPNLWKVTYITLLYSTFLLWQYG